MDIGGSIAQQFMGPLSELVHTINKLTIVKETSPLSDNPLGSGSGGSVASATLGATRLGAAVSAVQKIVAGADKFELQINPEKYERNYSVAYTDPPIINSPLTQQNFDRMEGGTLSLAFTLDGTGVVPSSVTDLGNFALQSLTKAIGVTDVSYVTRRIKELKKIIGDYEPSKHEPPARVKIIWGDEDPFVGRMDNMTVTYTLFHPSGVPLRAEILINFIEHNPYAVVSPQSPDLTHRRTIAQYDTLPLLTEAIYGDNTYAWQVAAANNLTHYRRLQVGQTLHFPPIERRLLRS